MDKNFLLTSRLARALYDGVKDLPIIDYHNHIAIGDVASDRRYSTITELWITPDPYKHRAMRILGIPEKYITGDGSDKEKFDAFCSCIPRLIGNPLYDWSLMELKTVFGIDLDASKIDTDRLYDDLNRALLSLTARKILERFNIEYSAPCASLTDSLDAYEGLSGFAPSLRADDALSPTPDFISRLADASGMEIKNLSDYISALDTRIAYFKKNGAYYSDHAIDDGFSYVSDDGKSDERFSALLSGETLSDTDRLNLSSYILTRCAILYARHDMTLQLHIGARRRTSDRLRTIAGPAGGYAAIGRTLAPSTLTELLNDVERSEWGLPKTLLFTLNPADNEIMANLSGSYSKDGVEAIVSQGPAWWWCDHYKGIYEMLDSFAAHSVLSTFIGMTTDSRSLLSFVRHDYFRRVLCAFTADKVSEGRMPSDVKLLLPMLKKICYENAKKTLKS